jgi:hypothetical protein
MKRTVSTAMMRTNLGMGEDVGIHLQVFVRGYELFVGFLVLSGNRVGQRKLRAGPWSLI